MISVGFNIFLVVISMSILTVMLMNRIRKYNFTNIRNRVTIPDLIFGLLYLIIFSIFGAIITCSVKFGLTIALILIFLFAIEELANHKESRKKRNIVNREFPLLLDFLVLQVESGHSILQAFKFASFLFPEQSPVNSGLNKFQETIQLGSSTQAALEELADYLSTESSKAALYTISQAIKHGTPLGEVLSNQANRMREHLLIQGEKFSHTLSIKLLIPLLFFIFPASFLVIFSPVIVSFSKMLP